VIVPRELSCALTVGVIAFAAGLCRAEGFVVTRHQRPAELTSMAQTANGYLWLGGSDGLTGFDGDRFVRDERVHGRVRRLLATRDGALWVATGEGELETDGERMWSREERGPAALLRLDADGTVAAVPMGGAARVSVWDLAEDRAGTVWLATASGLARVSPLARRAEVVAVPATLVPCVTIDDVGNVWFGDQQGLGRLEDGGVERVTPSLRGPVTDLVALAGGAFAVVARQRVLIGAPSTGFQDRGVSFALALMRDHAGRLWASTSQLEHQLQRTNAAGAFAPVVRAPPELTEITALLEDHERSVWAATREGALVQLRPSPAAPLDDPAEAPLHATFAVLPTGDGAVWTSSVDGLDRWREGRRELHLSRERLRLWNPRALTRDGADGVWLAGWPGLVHVHRDGSFEAAAVGQRGVSAVHVNAAGLWVAWTDGGVTRFSDGRLTVEQAFVGADAPCAGAIVWSFLDDHRGGLFAGTEAGLASWDGTRWVCERVADGLPSAWIAALALEADGTLWIGTRDEVGLVRRRGATHERFPLAAGERAGKVFGIVIGDEGKLWLSSDVGVRTTTIRELERAAAEARPPVVKVIGKRDGLPTDECMSGSQPSLVEDEAGRVYVATRLGASVLAPSAAVERSGAGAQLIIEEVAASGRAYATHEPVVVDRGSRDLLLRYTVPTFVASGALRFAYQLTRAGHPGRWVEVDDRRSLAFAGLEPGTHLVRLRARDADGAPVAETALSVTIMPQPWQTAWFWAAVAAIAAATLLAAHRMRVARLARAHAAVDEERTRIARDLHDTMAQGFTTLRLLVDAVFVRVPDLAEGARAVLEDARAAITQMQSELRRQVWQLRRRAGSDDSLAGALRAAVARVPRSAVPVRLDGGDAGLREVRLSAVAAHELPMIVGEALTNAVRHAAASEITVRASRAGEAVVVTIEDDGCGLPDDAATHGFGIVGMHERAAMMHASVDVAPREAGGTRVTISIPLREETAP
jgi:signal transduction histidine kinase/ligand-binding sensor domain-containing protein